MRRPAGERMIAYVGRLTKVSQRLLMKSSGFPIHGIKLHDVRSEFYLPCAKKALVQMGTRYSHWRSSQNVQTYLVKKLIIFILIPAEILCIACYHSLQINVCIYVRVCVCMYAHVVHGAMCCCRRSVKLVWQCHQLFSGFLVNGYFPRVSFQSRLSINDKDDELIPVAGHRSPDHYLKTEENPGKPQLGDRR